jgi:hypothetical protein
MHILCVFLRCVEWRAGTILTGHFGGVGGGTVRIFLSFWLCSGGYGTAELVRGVVLFSFAFFSLLSVLLAVGCLRYEIFFVIYFLLVAFQYFSAVSYFMSR